MTYVIGKACVDVIDKSCVQECPVDCIYEGARALYINPDECVDCGTCKLTCRVGAIYYESDLPHDQHAPTTPRSSVKFCRVEIALWARRAAPPSSGRSV